MNNKYAIKLLLVLSTCSIATTLFPQTPSETFAKFSNKKESFASRLIAKKKEEEKKNNVEKAQQYYTLASLDDPENVDVLRKLSRHLFNQKDYAQAAQVAEKILHKNL